MPLQPTPAFQRIGPLANLASLVETLGADPAQLSDLYGSDVRALHPDQRIPLHRGVELLELAAALTGCPHLGLLLGTTASEATQGVIFQLAMTAPDLRQFILDHITWQPGYASGAILYLNNFGDDYAFGYGIVDRYSLGSTQLYDCIMAMGVTLLRLVTAEAVRPSEMLMCRRTPDDLQPYRRVFRMPIRFNEPQTCIVLTRKALDTPLPGANAARRAFAERDLQNAFERAGDDVANQVRRILRPLMLDGMPSMSDAAQALGQSIRTLRRRLAAQNLTFEQIRDEVRFTVARELLVMTDLPVGDVAEALAFSTHAAFTNAFQRWSGTAPSAWRAEWARTVRPCDGRDAAARSAAQPPAS